MKQLICFISGLLLVIALAGCNSSSSTSSAGDNNSDVSGDMIATESNFLRLIRIETTDSSGESDITEYEYDEVGNLNAFSFDRATHRYTTNSQGQIISRDIIIRGLSAPTTPPDAVYYDPVGGLRRMDVTNDSGVRAIELYKFDGDVATNYEYRFLDAAVRPERVDETTGQFFQKIEYQYENGQLVRDLIDDDGDGVVDKQRDYSYNPDGTVSTALDTGSSPSSFVYIYERGDCNNNWGNSTHDHFCVPSNP